MNHLKTITVHNLDRRSYIVKQRDVENKKKTNEDEQ